MTKGEARSLPTVRAPRRSVRGRLLTGQANPVDIHIGQRMRMQRVLTGLSQIAVGEAVGVAFQQIQKYENAINRVSASRLWQISTVLGCPVSSFFDDITEAVAAASPRHITENSLPAASAPRQDLRMLKEGANLVRAFHAIKDERVRYQILMLAICLAQRGRKGDGPGQGDFNRP